MPLRAVVLRAAENDESPCCGTTFRFVCACPLLFGQCSERTGLDNLNGFSKQYGGSSRAQMPHTEGTAVQHNRVAIANTHNVLFLYRIKMPLRAAETIIASLSTCIYVCPCPLLSVQVLEWTGQDGVYRALKQYAGVPWAQLPHKAKKELLVAADQLDWSFVKQIEQVGYL